MRNWPRYSRGSLEAEEITRPRLKKIFFSTAFLVTMSVPVFCPRLSHWSRSPGNIVLRFPLTPIRFFSLSRAPARDKLQNCPTSNKPYFDASVLPARHFGPPHNLC